MLIFLFTTVLLLQLNSNALLADCSFLTTKSSKGRSVAMTLSLKRQRSAIDGTNPSNDCNNYGGALRRSTRLKSQTLQSQIQQEPPRPLLTIGVVADIQYAPIPDGNSWKGAPRYYRYALEQARMAAQDFQQAKVSLVINLGDIIDGKCAKIMEHGGERHEHGVESVDHVLDALSAYTHGPIIHTYGNHELYNLSREEISNKLNIPFVVEEPHNELVGYYSFKKHNIRFVVLDSYDIALMGRCPNTSAKRKEAERLLSLHNPNYPAQENSPEGLNGLKRRFVAFNGAVDKAQLEWLRETLHTAKSSKEKVIILSHQPILPGSSSPLCLIWNYNDLLQIMRQYKCTVIASFAGHAHRGGYARDKISGIHFRVFESVLETPRPHTTYGFVDIHEDFMRVRGIGECTSAVYDFSHMTAS